MTGALVVRSGGAADAAAVAEIYRPWVEESAASFELVAPDAEEMAARIARSNQRWRWLVAELDGEVAGYAYGTAHRARPAYRWSVEVSAYVHRNHHRKGIGRALYDRLLEELTALGYCNAYAGITLPNDGSVALHRALGFEPIGVFRSVGRKFGRWHDVAWLHRPLRDTPPEDEAPS